MTPTSVFKTRGPLDPVTDTAIYVTRPELEPLMRAAEATTIDAYQAVLSSRQTGKTTLLYQLRHRLRPRGFGVALIDLSIVQDQPEAQLYQFVADSVSKELEANLPRDAERHESALPRNPFEFRQFLFDLARRARAPRIVVLIDEVEAVPEALSDAFFGTIRNIFHSRRKEEETAFEKYLFVLAGAKELHRLSTGPNSPLNIAERIYLEDFDVAGIGTLVANFQKAGIRAPSETAQWLYDQTHGHPSLTQKLCSLIEQAHPAVITPAIVQRAAGEIQRNDDHLEKMVSQIDADSGMLGQLKPILAGRTVPFSRINSNIARLELAGAIRDEGKCVIRNEIYRKVFLAHLNLTSTKKHTRRLNWPRPVIAALAAIVILLNLPFLYSYTKNILLTPHSTIEKIEFPELGTSALVRYDRIVRTNDTTNYSLTLDATQLSVPIFVTFRTDDLDILITGDKRRRFDPPSHAERYEFSYEKKEIVYSPFGAVIPQSTVYLVFESVEGNKPTNAIAVDLQVDEYSAWLISLVTTFSGVIAFVAGLSTNLQRVGEFVRKLAQAEEPG
jgi:hypothetical protein